MAPNSTEELKQENASLRLKVNARLTRLRFQTVISALVFYGISAYGFKEFGNLFPIKFDESPPHNMVFLGSLIFASYSWGSFLVAYANHKLTEATFRKSNLNTSISDAVTRLNRIQTELKSLTREKIKETTGYDSLVERLKVGSDVQAKLDRIDKNFVKVTSTEYDDVNRFQMADDNKGNILRFKKTIERAGPELKEAIDLAEKKLPTLLDYRDSFLTGAEIEFSQFEEFCRIEFRAVSKQIRKVIREIKGLNRWDSFDKEWLPVYTPLTFSWILIVIGVLESELIPLAFDIVAILLSIVMAFVWAIRLLE